MDKVLRNLMLTDVILVSVGLLHWAVYVLDGPSVLQLLPMSHHLHSGASKQCGIHIPQR